MRRGSSAWVEKFWGPAPINKKLLVKYTFHGGGAAWIRVETLSIWSLLNKIFEKHDYVIRKKDTGGYNHRKIAGTDRWSNHAYGTAIDFNWTTNPRLDRNAPMVCDMPDEMIAEIRGLKTKKGLSYVRWGGDYKWVDPMHFEVMLTPNELSHLGHSVDIPESVRIVKSKESLLKKGDNGLNVQFLQKLLLNWDPSCLPKFGADSDFGGETFEAVTKFQKQFNLEPSGSIDFMTAIALSKFI